MAEPAGREIPGDLFIRDVVAERIAVAAAARVPGCLLHSGNFERLTRRRYPKVDIEMNAQAVAVDMHIAVAWPAPVADVAATVRDTVSAHLAAHLGRPVVRCDVHVAAVVPSVRDGHPTEPTRVTLADIETAELTPRLRPIGAPRHRHAGRSVL